MTLKNDKQDRRKNRAQCGSCTACDASGNCPVSLENLPVDGTITVALAGNPNSGKTTLFNELTGSRQHVGNWPGVTVEKKQGTLIHNGREISVVDLPGIYSLTAYSMEEVVSRDFVVKDSPHLIINIVDASNLERNLYLTVQLLELCVPLVLGLNMADVAEGLGIRIDVAQLSALLGAPVMSLVASKGRGVEELLRCVERRPAVSCVRINYGREIEGAIGELERELEKKRPALPVSSRWIALKLLERDSVVERDVKSAGGEAVLALRDKLAARLEELLGDDSETLIVDRRYGYITGLLKEVFTRPVRDKQTATEHIDAVLTNRVVGIPILILAMWAAFQMTFKLGAAPMGWLDALFTWLGGMAHGLFGPTLVGSLVGDGIIGGVGGVVSFLPNIMLLFLAIAVLEDTGYMSRAAFIMDKVMHKLNLHGKSFIPMLIGFGCSVPAIMAARTLENRRDRIVTILVTPLMSCGARLPVYVLLAGAFFSPAAAGNVIFSIYFIGVMFAILLARLFRGVLLKGDSTPFVMELPPYRMPTVKNLLLHMWERAWMYIKKAGTIILGFTVVLWALMTFPRDFPGRAGMEMELKSRTAVMQEEAGRAGAKPGDETWTRLRAPIADIEKKLAAEHLANSVAGQVGKLIEPLLRPLGFDWKMSVALVSGVAAKEVIVSTLGTVYSIGEGGGTSNALKQAIRKDPAMSPLSAYVLMLFVLLTIPCMSTIAVIKRETDSWGWPVFSVAYHTALAWVVCFVVYQGGRMIGL